jgi:hypothetical protein
MITKLLASSIRTLTAKLLICSGNSGIAPSTLFPFSHSLLALCAQGLAKFSIELEMPPISFP